MPIKDGQVLGGHKLCSSTLGPSSYWEFSYFVQEYFTSNVILVYSRHSHWHIPTIGDIYAVKIQTQKITILKLITAHTFYYCNKYMQNYSNKCYIGRSSDGYGYVKVRDIQLSWLARQGAAALNWTAGCTDAVLFSQLLTNNNQEFMFVELRYWFFNFVYL